MLSNKNLWRASTTLLLAGAAFAQSPTTTPSDPMPSLAAPFVTTGPRLDLRLTAAMTLELSGGMPGRTGTIVVDGLAPVTGTFDDTGTLSLPVPAGLDAVSELVVRGFAVETDDRGLRMLRSSDALHVQVKPVDGGEPIAPPASAPAADFSLLRIELDSFREQQVVDALRGGDLASALATALNSDGDELKVKLAGKVMVPVEGVSLGGSVAFSAKLQRQDDGYLLRIGRDVAVLCGVKATEDIGIEGGVGLGSDEIYRFGSPQEVGRGLLDLALLQAIGDSAIELQRLGEGRLAGLRHRLGVATQALRDYRAHVRVRLPRVEQSLARATAFAATAAAAAERALDAVHGFVGFLADETRFIEGCCDGAELRVSTTGEIEVMVGKKAVGRVGAELGAKAGVARTITLRLHQRYREAATRIEASIGTAVTGAFVCQLQTVLGQTGKHAVPAIECSATVTRSVKTTFDRLASGDFGPPQIRLEIERELRFGPFGRKTTFAVDALALAAAGEGTVEALMAGDPSALSAAVGTLAVDVTVQDSWTNELEQDVGIEKGMTAKIGFAAGWTDCGPKRATTWTLDDVLTRLADVEAREADARALLQQANELHLLD